MSFCPLVGQLLAVDEEHNALAASCYFPMYMHGESTVRDASGEANSKIEKAEGLFLCWLFLVPPNPTNDKPLSVVF